MPSAHVLGAWEATVASDTPTYREGLRAIERDAAVMHDSASNLLALSRSYVKAAAAQVHARKALQDALVSATTDAMRHPDLKGSPAAKATPLAELADALTRLAITDEMGMRQVQTLLVEPLVSLLDETEGLSGAGRLQEAFRSTSAEYYDALRGW